jgi:hypothetical protein
MDQTILNWFFAGFGGTLGWILKVVWDAIAELRMDMKKIERDLPEVYVRKDDFKDLKQDMKDGFASVTTTLNLIFKKLDAKSDKE